MTKTFIIASTGDRKDGLCRLIISLTPFIKSGWTISAVCQGYSEGDKRDIKNLVGKNGKVFAFDNLIGAHSAKMVALNDSHSDVWCSLDDDMFAIPKTNYDKIADVIFNDKSMGFISGNWARSIKQADSKDAKDELIPQKLVFTGGGLFFRDDVADIIRDIPNEQYLFDDCLWAMYAYINGYNNYRYRGSIAVHQICSKGGRRTWMEKSKSDRVLPPEEYLRVRKGSAENGYNQYLICNDSDLTELSHSLHKENIKGV